MTEDTDEENLRTSFGNSFCFSLVIHSTISTRTLYNAGGEILGRQLRQKRFLFCSQDATWEKPYVNKMRGSRRQSGCVDRGRVFACGWWDQGELWKFLSSAPRKSTATYYLQIRRWAFVLHKPRHRGGELVNWGQKDCWAQEGWCVINGSQQVLESDGECQGSYFHH